MRPLEIPEVSESDLHLVWKHWPEFQEQAAPGPPRHELIKQMSAGADFDAVLRRAAMLWALCKHRSLPVNEKMVDVAATAPLGRFVDEVIAAASR